MEDQIILEEENAQKSSKKQKIMQEEFPKETQKDQGSSEDTSQNEKSAKTSGEISEIKSIPISNTIQDKKEEASNDITKNQNEDYKTTYILKYSRTKSELKELSEDTKLKKAETCQFMLTLNLLPIESNLNTTTTQNEKKSDGDTPGGPENYLVISCHEMAALYFDEIYEKIYTLHDLCEENRYFRIFPNTDEAKIVIDEFIKINQTNRHKFFIEFKDKEFKIHMKFSFFDQEKEIIFNIPKKKLSGKQINNILPEFLKEIQNKLILLGEENKKLKGIILDKSKVKEFKLDFTENNEKVNGSLNGSINNSKSIKRKYIKKGK